MPNTILRYSSVVSNIIDFFEVWRQILHQYQYQYHYQYHYQYQYQYQFEEEIDRHVAVAVEKYQYYYCAVLLDDANHNPNH